MKRSRLTILVVLASLAVLLLVPFGDVLARPGGGHGFGGGGSPSSGGSGGGSSGSGGGGDILALIQIVFWLLELTFRYPMFMLPIWGLVILLVWLNRKKPGKEWTTGSAAASEQPVALLRQQLERLREADPQFSVIVFEDFLQALYARVHEARGAHTLASLAPYLAPAVRAKLEEGAAALEAVEAVIVGAMSYVSVRGLEGRTVVVVQFEANYTEVTAGVRRRYYVPERWTLSRARGARSRPPEKVRSFGCPSCGAPFDGGEACAYCGQVVATGEVDWCVDAVVVERKEERGPELAGYAVERGTLTPTIVDPEAEGRRRELVRRDPVFAWEGFTDRVKHIFDEIQVAWSTPDLALARPYLSDNLYATWTYWIDAYRAAGLRNVTQDTRVLGMRLARVMSDAYYDAITVRVRASGLDYTVDGRGAVVAGSRSEPREYSEYWTLIRGSATRGVARTDKNCPKCGAPLAVNMAGSCEHCFAHVVSGEFDWVLSRIEQDETYQG